jgi:hypothetical protein
MDARKKELVPEIGNSGRAATKVMEMTLDTIHL